jgi:hypothetical protein
MLQARRSKVRFPIKSLDFSIDLIVPVDYGPGGKGQPAHKLATSLLFVSQMSRKCRSCDVSQPYGPPQPVTGIALFLYFYLI